MCSSVHLCSSVFLPTTPHHHPESPLKKPSRILTARIQATLNRLTSCALAASGEIVWNGEEIQASPHEKAKKMQGYTGAQRVDSGAMVEKQLTCSPVKGEKLQRTLLSLKALTSWFLSILCQLSQAGTETHQASANTNSHRLVEAVETNQVECVFSHFSQAFKMTCALGREVTLCVFFCLKLQSERSTAAMGSRVVNVVLVFLSGHSVWGRLWPGRMHLPWSGCWGEQEQSQEGARRKWERDAVRRRTDDCFAAKPQTICHNRQKQKEKS